MHREVSLLDLGQKRLIIVTGKGGVGKTTLTAGLARALAARGKRVLCTEIVPLAETPSQLKTSLSGPPMSEEPVLVADNLWAALLTPGKGHLRFLQDTLHLQLLASAAMKSQGIRRFLAAAPGFSDMGVMYRMLDLMKRQNPNGGPMFDVCLIDSPATGHALALAQIPEFLTRVIRGGPIYRIAKEGVELLTDPKLTTTVVVTLPETLPVTEALDLRLGLMKHRLPVSMVVVNRVPVNPFSVEEQQAVGDVLKGPSNVFGARELRRIERAEAALTLLKEKYQGESVSLPDVPDATPADAATRLSAMLS